MLIAGWSSLAARRAHNPKVVGSNPTPATIFYIGIFVERGLVPLFYGLRMKRIQDLIEPTVRALGLELWACELHQSNHRALLRVYIDRASGVTLEDCTQVSREIGAILDVEDPIKNRYELEISSPGLNRTLSTLSHFQKYIGAHVKVRLRHAVSDRKQFEARIEKVEGDKILLVIENETMSVTLGEIQKANLI